MYFLLHSAWAIILCSAVSIVAAPTTVQDITTQAHALGNTSELLIYDSVKESSELLNRLQKTFETALITTSASRQETAGLAQAKTLLATALITKVMLWNYYQALFNNGDKAFEITVNLADFDTLKTNLEKEISGWIGQRWTAPTQALTSTGKKATAVIGFLKQVGQGLKLTKNPIIESLVLDPKEYGKAAHKDNVARYFAAIELFVIGKALTDNDIITQAQDTLDNLPSVIEYRLSKQPAALGTAIIAYKEQEKAGKVQSFEEQRAEILAKVDELIGIYKGSFTNVEQRDKILKQMRELKEQLGQELFASDKRLQQRVELLGDGITTILYLYSRLASYCKGTLVAAPKNKELARLTSDTVLDLLKPTDQECSDAHKQIISDYFKQVYHYTVVITKMKSDDPTHVKEWIENELLSFINSLKTVPTSQREKLTKEIKIAVDIFII